MPPNHRRSLGPDPRASHHPQRMEEGPRVKPLERSDLGNAKKQKPGHPDGYPGFLTFNRLLGAAYREERVAGET